MPGEGGMILLLFALLLFVPGLTVFLVIKGSQRRRRRKLAAYTGRTQGTVHRWKPGGLDHPDVIEVGYTVDGRDYLLRETVKQKNQWIKVGKLPIGQWKVPCLGPLQVGDPVLVQYDKAHPHKGVLPQNGGVMTG